MKITKVTPWLIEAPAPFLDTADDSKNLRALREYLFVEVNTDEGITGWGEVTAQSPRALPICVDQAQSTPRQRWTRRSNQR